VKQWAALASILCIRGARCKGIRRDNGNSLSYFGGEMIRAAEILEELLRFEAAQPNATGALKELTHDALCRQTTDQIGVLLESFGKYQNIAYDVQGPRDQGIDVLFKFSGADQPEKMFGLQIKAYKEIDDRNNDLSKQLKAGLHDARRHYDYQLERYYILLFGDANVHRKRLSAITNEFAKDDLVRIIGPRTLVTFLNLPESTIYAVADHFLSDEDYVRKLARREVLGYKASRLYFILACLCWSFENLTEQLPEGFLMDDSRMRDLVGRFGLEKFESAFSYFEDKDLEIYLESSSMKVRTENYPAVRALYFDLQVRYGESADELFSHLYEFLRI
jgi:hypothetical protein